MTDSELFENLQRAGLALRREREAAWDPRLEDLCAGATPTEAERNDLDPAALEACAPLDASFIDGLVDRAAADLGLPAETPTETTPAPQEPSLLQRLARWFENQRMMLMLPVAVSPLLRSHDSSMPLGAAFVAVFTCPAAVPASLNVVGATLFTARILTVKQWCADYSFQFE